MMRKATENPELVIQESVSNAAFLRYDEDRNNKIDKAEFYKILYSDMRASSWKNTIKIESYRDINYV